MEPSGRRLGNIMYYGILAVFWAGICFAGYYAERWKARIYAQEFRNVR
jgi:hypothetical protein